MNGVTQERLVAAIAPAFDGVASSMGHLVWGIAQTAYDLGLSDGREESRADLDSLEAEVKRLTARTAAAMKTPRRLPRKTIQQQIREVLEAAGHDATYVEKRMEGIEKQADVAVLKKILANERKRLKNGNANGKEEK